MRQLNRYYIVNESFHSSVILNTGTQRAVTGTQPAEGGDGGAEGADEGSDADPGPGVESARPI